MVTCCLKITSSFHLMLLPFSPTYPVSTIAGQNMQINRFNKPTLIPVAEDTAVSVLFTPLLNEEVPWCRKYNIL